MSPLPLGYAHSLYSDVSQSRDQQMCLNVPQEAVEAARAFCIKLNNAMLHSEHGTLSSLHDRNQQPHHPGCPAAGDLPESPKQLLNELANSSICHFVMHRLPMQAILLVHLQRL